jgi:dihydrodipicolinate synthase/N-acetylneuraminate lyase
VQRSFPRIPVVVGIHTCDLAEAQRQVLAARELGAAAVLVKYTGRPNAAANEVLLFMRGLGGMQALPVFYDHCPARSGVDLSTADVAQLMGLPGIVGIREAPGALSELEEHVKLCENLNRAFFSATALNLTQFLNAGGCGAMCPEALLLPEPTVKLYRSYAAGRQAEAVAIQEELYTLAPLYRLHPALPLLERVAYMTVQDFKPTAPTGQEEPQAQMKAALCALGVPTPTWVKSPLPRLTIADQHCVASTISSVKRIDWCEVTMRVPPAPLGDNRGGKGERHEGGMLLKTGAFQLGTGVSKDLLRSVNDGYGGFFP